VVLLLVVLAAAVGPDEGARWLLLFVLRVDVKLLALVVHAERDDHNQQVANHSRGRRDAFLTLSLRPSTSSDVTAFRRR
jgi:hypothetical protein